MRKRFFCLMILLCYALAGCQAVSSESRDDAAKLLCLNIGKADCMLLMYGNANYLIDTGYEQTWPALETALSQYGVTWLNGVFLTHCHEDHGRADGAGGKQDGSGRLVRRPDLL